MSASTQPDRQMGLLSQLIDDVLLRILCHCGIIDLLRIEQTCKYLRSLLGVNREVWFAAILKLPREASPGITPHQTSKEVDYRELAVKAIRGYKNWTSEYPTPTCRRSLDLSLPKFVRTSELQVLPGGRYVIYILEQTLYCFDVVQNQYVVKHELVCTDPFTGCPACDMNSDGTSVRTFVAFQSSSRPGLPRELFIEYMDIDLNLRNTSPSRITTFNWQDLERAAEVRSMMPRNLTLGKDIILASFEGEDIASRIRTRVGVLIDLEKGLILFLTFKLCESDGDQYLPIRVVNSHLLYFSGCRTGNPTVHAVPLSYFEKSWRRTDNWKTWDSHKVKPGHGTHFSFVDCNIEAPISMHIGVHNATWLDLETACSRDPTVTCLSLIDVGLYSDKVSSSNGVQFPSFFHLQFLERRDPFSGELFGQFVLAEGPAEIPVELLSSRIEWKALPSRHGRMVAFTKSLPSSNYMGKAVSLMRDSAHFTSLTHLDSKVVQNFAMDFYTGIVIVCVSPKRERGSSVKLSRSTEVFAEYYD